ncbi:hypothetical protein ABW21_db0203755 [Orbilia brochopaga]|nr:hypothetical protein ABW21_db0203755 [Drechslerella brochopaga]
MKRKVHCEHIKVPFFIKQGEAYFELRYTRTCASLAKPNLSVVDNPRMQVIWSLPVKYSIYDPAVIKNWIDMWVEREIVAFYEPESKTLISRADVFKICEFKLWPGGKPTWMAVYRKQPLAFRKRLTLLCDLALDDFTSPLLYIEDLSRGRYNNTLFKVLKSGLWDRFGSCKKAPRKDKPTSAEVIEPAD